MSPLTNRTEAKTMKCIFDVEFATLQNQTVDKQ